MDNKEILEQAKQILSKQDASPFVKVKPILDEKEYAILACLISRAEVALWQDRLTKGEYKIADAITIVQDANAHSDKDNRYIHNLKGTGFIVPVVFPGLDEAISFSNAITQGSLLED